MMLEDTTGYRVDFRIGRHSLSNTEISPTITLDLIDRLDELSIPYSIVTGQYAYGSGLLTSTHYLTKDELRGLCSGS